MKALDFIVHELHPKYDMSKVDTAFKPLCHSSEEPLGRCVTDAIKTTGCRIYYMAKPFVRGGLIGAALGRLTSSVTGDDPSYCASAGALIGMTIDCAQLYPRLLYHGARSCVKGIKQVFTKQE